MNYCNNLVKNASVPTWLLNSPYWVARQAAKGGSLALKGGSKALDVGDALGMGLYRYGVKPAYRYGVRPAFRVGMTGYNADNYLAQLIREAGILQGRGPVKNQSIVPRMADAARFSAGLARTPAAIGNVLIDANNTISNYLGPYQIENRTADLTQQGIKAGRERYNYWADNPYLSWMLPVRRLADWIPGVPKTISPSENTFLDQANIGRMLWSNRAKAKNEVDQEFWKDGLDVPAGWLRAGNRNHEVDFSGFDSNPQLVAASLAQNIWEMQRDAPPALRKKLLALSPDGKPVMPSADAIQSFLEQHPDAIPSIAKFNKTYQDTKGKSTAYKWGYGANMFTPAVTAALSYPVAVPVTSSVAKHMLHSTTGQDSPATDKLINRSKNTLMSPVYNLSATYRAGNKYYDWGSRYGYGNVGDFVSDLKDAAVEMGAIGYNTQVRPAVAGMQNWMQEKGITLDPASIPVPNISGPSVPSEPIDINTSKPSASRTEIRPEYNSMFKQQ